MGRSGVLTALDWGSEAAGASDDGKQWLRRCFGEELCSGEEDVVD
jgi:hypothetical protein